MLTTDTTTTLPTEQRDHPIGFESSRRERVAARLAISGSFGLAIAGLGPFWIAASPVVAGCSSPAGSSAVGVGLAASSECVRVHSAWVVADGPTIWSAMGSVGLVRGGLVVLAAVLGSLVAFRAGRGRPVRTPLTGSVALMLIAAMVFLWEQGNGYFGFAVDQLVERQVGSIGVSETASVVCTNGTMLVAVALLAVATVGVLGGRTSVRR